MRPWVVAVLGLALALDIRGQSSACDYLPEALDCRTRWLDHAAVIGANVLVGAVTAGVWQQLRGGSFTAGFARGALGGFVVYGGKQVAAIRMDGAGLVGRELAAVGSSMVRNAADGTPMLGRLTLPAGPLPLRVERRASGWRLRLDGQALWWAGVAISTGDLALDLRRSWADGAMVWVADSAWFDAGTRSTPALAAPWAIFANRGALDATGGPAVRAHERLHVIQADQFALIISDPIDEWVGHQVPVLGRVGRWVALGLGVAAFAYPQTVMQRSLGYEYLPWEVESMVLAGDLR